LHTSAYFNSPDGEERTTGPSAFDPIAVQCVSDRGNSGVWHTFSRDRACHSARYADGTADTPGDHEAHGNGGSGSAHPNAGAREHKLTRGAGNTAWDTHASARTGDADTGSWSDFREDLPDCLG
jgi:hypothetical protein